MKNTETPTHSAKLHLARLLSGVVPCDRCVVYDIDNDLVPNGHIAHDGDTRWVDPYTHFLSIDPMRPELYVTAAALASGIYVIALSFGAPPTLAALVGGLAGFALRAAAISRGLSLPAYRG